MKNSLILNTCGYGNIQFCLGWYTLRWWKIKYWIFSYTCRYKEWIRKQYATFILFMKIMKSKKKNNLTKIKTWSYSLRPVLCTYISFSYRKLLYSYRRRHCESPYPFDIVSLYSLSVQIHFFSNCCARSVFNSIHVAYIKLEMSYFHDHEWLFLY